MLRHLWAAFLLLPASVAADKAPRFTLDTAAGNPVTLPREHDGVDIYLFWATWCPYCRRLMPHIQSIEDEYGDRTQVFAIHFRDDDGDPEAYIRDRGFEFTLLPAGDEVAKRYDMRGTPGLVLVDGSGEIRFNLYELQEPAGRVLEGLDHGQRAERLAPWWAARIRQAMDEILARESTERGPG